MLKKFLIASVVFILFSSLHVSAQLKGDPWIFQAYKALYNRQPSSWELNIHNYNDGSWNNYNELATYIIQYQAAMTKAGLTVTTTSIGGGRDAALFNQNGRTIAADIISQDGGSLVAQGGGNLVAQGGGNLVAQGGGNLRDLKGVSFGPPSTRVPFGAGNQVVKTAGNVALIIK